jgi:inorganic pyrophosphatase
MLVMERGLLGAPAAGCAVAQVCGGAQGDSGKSMARFTHLPHRDANGHVHVVVEAPRGSVVKWKYEPKLGVFVFNRPLPLGLAYPYDWGFVPSTEAEDGDPLDAMVIHEGASFPGAVIPSRAIGVVRMTQKEKGHAKAVRNDRVVLVPRDDARYAEVSDLVAKSRAELERFFVGASKHPPEALTIEGWDGARVAERLIDDAAQERKKRS